MFNKIILNKKSVFLIIFTGAIIRFFGAFLYGTADMEWWKAYGTYSVHHGFIDIYGRKDSEILSLYGKKFPINEIISKTQRIIPYPSYKTYYTEYPFHQPPIYIYSIAISSWIYSIISPDVPNNRFFNFFINIEPILSSIIISLGIWKIVSVIRNSREGAIAGLLYWIHPLVILNSPIQGYRDPMVALFALASIYFLYKKNLNLSFIFLACSSLVKPQGILIAPVVIACGLTIYSLRKNLIAWIYGILSVAILSFPFIVNNYGLSMILGISAISKSTEYLSGAPDIWLIVQYIITAWQNTHNIHNFMIKLATQPFSHVIIEGISKRIGFNIELIGFVFLFIFTVLNIYFLYKRLRNGKIKSVFLFSALQVYGYTQLRVGVQINHYFTLIPLLTVSFFVFPKIRKTYTIVCTIFFLYDLAFYGLGRDSVGLYKIMEKISLLWLIIPFSIINIFLFINLCKHVWQPLIFFKKRVKK